MKIIVCSGDSHTWGQGAASLDGVFDTPVVGGELRPLPFEFPCYVNMLRAHIEGVTDSDMTNYIVNDEISGELVIPRRAELARIFIRLDGENNYRHIAVFASDGDFDCEFARISVGDRLCIRPKAPFHLYRVELYNGEYAVINAGVGSCTTRRYLSQFYDGYVKRFSPYAVVAQAHTINDWLNNIPVEEAEANLIRILNGCGAVKRLLVTVSPITGPTALPFNSIEYDEYIEASRRACIRAGATLCDANIAIGRDKFSDNWHVNEYGHEIYADEIIKSLGEPYREI